MPGLHAGAADALQINLVGNILRSMNRAPGPRQNAPRSAVVALDERADRLSLAIVGMVIDQNDRDAVAFVNRSRPVDENREVESVEHHALEHARVDVPRPTALAL